MKSIKNTRKKKNIKKSEFREKFQIVVEKDINKIKRIKKNETQKIEYCKNFRFNFPL